MCSCWGKCDFYFGIKNPQVVKELKELNTANSTTYLLSNGDRRLEIYMRIFVIKKMESM